MKLNLSRLSVTAAASVALIALTSALAPAQQAPAPAPRADTLPAGQVLVQIGQNAGAIVLVDSTVQGRLALPALPATAATVEEQIADAVRALPAGTTWAKLYVPVPANGRWNGDAVATYAHALAQMVGTVGRAAPAGMVEILGRNVPADKASEYVTALNLKLVYLVTNPREQTTTTAGLGAASNWAQMTPAQRELYADQQAQRLMALNPADRFQVLRQMMQQYNDVTPQQMIIRMVMGQMSDDERVALKQSFAGDKQAAGGGK